MIFAANFTWDAVSQLTVTGVINGAAYGLLGVGFALILGRDRAIPLRLQLHVHAWPPT